MDIEEIIKYIALAIIACISIVSRTSRNKRAQSAKKPNNKPTIDSQSNRQKGGLFDEFIKGLEARLDELNNESEDEREWVSQEGESQEEIIDEISESYKSTKSPSIQKKMTMSKVQVNNNAINQTFYNSEINDKNINKKEDSSRKFNLREAVIYTEILTPKFKEEERE